MVDGAPSFMFTSSTYTMATSAAERIAVDQVAKLAQTGTATAATQRESSGIYQRRCVRQQANVPISYIDQLPAVFPILLLMTRRANHASRAEIIIYQVA